MNYYKELETLQNTVGAINIRISNIEKSISNIERGKDIDLDLNGALDLFSKTNTELCKFKIVLENMGILEVVENKVREID